MSDSLVLGIDLGLSGIRTALMDRTGKVIVVSGRYPIPTSSGFGKAEQDPRDWLGALAKASLEVTGSVDSGRIEAIGVSAFGPAPVLVDAALEPQAPALLFSLDARAEEQRARLASSLNFGDDQLNHDHAIPKLLWWKESHPDIWSRTTWALDATGFIVSHLTGRPTMDRITACDYTLAGFECPIKVPDPIDPLAPAGNLTDSWAGRLGIQPGIPVLAGTYDAYADTAAAGTMTEGDACVILGTTLIIGVVVPELPADLRGLVSSPHLGEGHLVGGWTSTGCSALDWARELTGTRSESSDDLQRVAATLPPGGNGLMFLPYLAGERSPVHDAAARGLLIGLTSGAGPSHVYRAVIDGLALSIRDHGERLADIGIRAATWRASGGGSRNSLLVQATSDALGKPIEIVADASAPIGPCLMAWRGLGVVPPVRISETCLPNARSAHRFDLLYQIYRKLYSATATQMHDLTHLGATEGVQS